MPLRLALTLAAALTVLGAAAVLWLTGAGLETAPRTADAPPASPEALAASEPRSAAPGPAPAPPASEEPSTLPTPAQATAAPRFDAAAGAYDDSHLYRGDPVAGRWPATAQGLLEAFRLNARATSACLAEHRRRYPNTTGLQTVEVRLATQEGGVAQVEEVRLPGLAEPTHELGGCLLRALLSEGFDPPPGGHLRLSQNVDLSLP